MEKQNWQEITTSPFMNCEIKKLLELRGDNVSLYALKRINELEASEDRNSTTSESVLNLAVQGNEQTKKVCELCGMPIHPVLGAVCALDGCSGRK